MTQVTLEQISQFRTKLADYPHALTALSEIEQCEGNLEDAAVVLAIRVGQQPDIANADWLDSLAKTCRAAICQAEYRNYLVDENYGPIMSHLLAAKLCPALLATPVLMYVIQQGANNFCEALDPVL